VRHAGARPAPCSAAAVSTPSRLARNRVMYESMRQHDARRMLTGNASGHARRACWRMGGFGRTPPPRDDRVANPASDGSGLAAPSSTRRPKRRQTRPPTLASRSSPAATSSIQRRQRWSPPSRKWSKAGSGGIGHGLSLVGVLERARRMRRARALHEERPSELGVSDVRSGPVHVRSLTVLVLDGTSCGEMLAPPGTRGDVRPCPGGQAPDARARSGGAALARLPSSRVAAAWNLSGSP
jgi:hypothetical protein